MSSWATVGAKAVLAVDLSFVKPYRYGTYRGPRPTKGEILTIAAIEVWPVEHAVFDYGNSIIGIQIKYLRPLVSESDDIKTFRNIASNLPTAKELEDSVQLALERLG